MKGKAQEGESIEPSEIEDNKNNSVKEKKKNIMFGARKWGNVDRWQRNSNYLIAALFLLLLFLIKEPALKVGGGQHN